MKTITKLDDLKLQFITEVKGNFTTDVTLIIDKKVIKDWCYMTPPLGVIPYLLLQAVKSCRTVKVREQVSVLCLWALEGKGELSKFANEYLTSNTYETL